MPAEDDFLKREPTGQPLALGAWGRLISTSRQKDNYQNVDTSAGQSAAAVSWATPAEASGWLRTSTAAETQAYTEALAGSNLPCASRLTLSEYGKSEEGRPLTLVTVAEPSLGSLADVRESEKICVHVNANIHAGEVEGKECVQQLLREFAKGQHSELLKEAVLLFSICCNPDGNDDFSAHHRVDQNGPAEVGVRPNAHGLDLNRDFIKLEAAEVRGLVDVFQQADPAVFVDLHATNGSHHGACCHANSEIRLLINILRLAIAARRRLPCYLCNISLAKRRPRPCYLQQNQAFARDQAPLP
jgi:murein tripeptide amidase MpaA